MKWLCWFLPHPCVVVRKLGDGKRQMRCKRCNQLFMRNDRLAPGRALMLDWDYELEDRYEGVSL